MRSDAEGQPHHNEIIIVRRVSNEEEGHHGGVWKIAFADFMTAMMAFFLVMWLTNASDDATKKQIAQYFNPIKLNDTAPATRGLQSGEAGANPAIPEPSSSPVEPVGEPNGKPIAGEREGGEEQAIFRDPYAVLAEIAAEGGSGPNGPGEAAGKPDGTGLPGLNGGEAYRDPFDPTSWQLQPNSVASGGELASAPPSEMPPSDFKTQVSRQEGGEAAKPQAPGVAAEEAPQAPAPASGAAAELKEDIAQELAKLNGRPASDIEVSEGEGGVTISLSDNLDTGMFQLGSAKPTADAIRMMEKIAAILQTRQGTITIRGHTDARPYRGGDYDNWRLSTARAHMAYYMLLRGGLDEARVQAIEGFADRRLKLAGDPEAAANRRIEILLTEPKP